MCSDWKEKMKKYLVKSGLITASVCVGACFTKSKDDFSYMVHLNPISLFNMFVMFFRSSTRFGMNLLKKFIFPIKYCSSLMFLGWLIFNIPSTLFGPILIPSSDMMWHKIFPSWRPNKFFLGFKDKPYFCTSQRLFLSDLGVLHQFLSRLWCHQGISQWSNLFILRKKYPWIFER